MKKTRKNRGPALPLEQFALEHPFVRWFAAYHKRGAATCADRDLMMGVLASKRFSIGLDEDKVPVLGVADLDVEAVTSIPWKAAFFLRRIKGRDWVVLSCDDARIEAPRSDIPIPLRLWLPASDGLLDGWMSVPVPVTLRVLETAVSRTGMPLSKGGSPLLLLPLMLKGAWVLNS